MLGHRAADDPREDSVLIDRSHVVQALRSGGRAEEELAVHVDTVRDADLFRELGLDPDSRAQGGGSCCADGAVRTSPRTPAWRAGQRPGVRPRTVAARSTAAGSGTRSAAAST